MSLIKKAVKQITDPVIIKYNRAIEEHFKNWEMPLSNTKKNVAYFTPDFALGKLDDSGNPWGIKYECTNRGKTVLVQLSTFQKGKNEELAYALVEGTSRNTVKLQDRFPTMLEALFKEIEQHIMEARYLRTLSIKLAKELNLGTEIAVINTQGEIKGYPDIDYCFKRTYLTVTVGPASYWVELDKDADLYKVTPMSSSEDALTQAELKQTAQLFKLITEMTRSSY